MLPLSMKGIANQCDLIWAITRAQMKSRYRKTLAGFLWVVLNPLLTFVVQALIFKHILKVEMKDYFVFLLSGLVPWIFIMSSVTMTVSTFVINRSTLMAFKISPWIFLVSQILDNFINFLAAFFVMIFLIDFTLLLNPWLLPLLLISTILLVLFVFFLSFFLATLNVFFRDTQYIVQFLTTLVIFITPVFYPVTLLPKGYQQFIQWNPFYILIKPFQNLLWKYDLSSFSNSFFQASLLVVVLMIVSVIYWRKKHYELFFRI